MLLLSALLVFAAVQGGLTAPLNQEYVTWHAEPNVRGTWSILSSCVVTLVLCVYSAVHVNVPAPHESRLERLVYMSKWVLAGVFAPEVVVWTAWNQWAAAKSLSRELEELRSGGTAKSEQSGGSSHHSNYQSLDDLLDTWTLQHSFFVVMGGFQFHPARGSQVYVSKGTPVCAMNDRLFLRLLKDGHVTRVPVVTSKDLADRTKADHLAKLLSCIQGLWLAFQLLGRVIGRLTITELEVNTFAHVLCAVAMYAFWMNKPLNLAQPMLVDTEGLEGWILAHSSFQFEMRSALNHARRAFSPHCSPMLHTHDALGWKASFQCSKCDDEPGLDIRVGVILNGSSIRSDASQVVDMMAHNPNAFSFNFVMRGEFTEKQYEWLWRGKTPELVWLSSQEELEIFIRIYQSPNTQSIINTAPDFCLERKVSMLPRKEDLDILSVYVMLVVSSCYGALHASLWGHHFPTMGEQWLWRISSVVVAANPPFVLLIAFISPTYESTMHRFVLEPRRQRRGCRLVVKAIEFYRRTNSINWLFSWLLEILMVFVRTCVILVPAIFLCCRAFLFIEAFISLRSQPPSAYEVLQWTQFFPHL